MKNLLSLIPLLVFADLLLAQNVGIGTNTPNYPLTVIANGNGRGFVQKMDLVEMGIYPFSFTGLGKGATIGTLTDNPVGISVGNKNPAIVIIPDGRVSVGPGATSNISPYDFAVFGSSGLYGSLYVGGEMEVKNNVGFGVSNPAYRLDIAGRIRIRSGGTSSTSAGIWLNKIDNSGLLGFVGVDGNNDIGIYSNTSGWSFLVDDATGNVTVKGTVKANGVTLTSDERLKKDITPLDEAMPLLEKLNGYQYHWKDASWDASLQTGLLAQEVEKVLPELVKTDDKGMKSVNYLGLIPYMLEAVKEQQAVNITQQKQIEELKKLVTELLKK
ncbi:MAG TPA: tail fiber domain-containing protein [Phnomibacter sp.]|nr:tail fiber domain-containing protein [Phnomibacter sp.]